MQKISWVLIFLVNIWSLVGRTDSSGVHRLATPEPEPVNEIVVTAPRRPSCDLDTIKRRLNHTHDPIVDGIQSTAHQIFEFNYFQSGRYNLSCKGEPNCHGHIFRILKGDVKIEDEPGGISITVGGNIEPGRRLTRRVSINYGDILDANDQSAYMTCEPGRCEAYLLDHHRNENGSFVNGAVVLIRKNKAGVETAQLIMNSSDAAVYADDEINIGRSSNKFKPCPLVSKIKKQTNRIEHRENSKGAGAK